MNYKNIITNSQNRILYLTINRESKLNALNKETLNELHLAIMAALSDEKIGGIILTGAGQKAFVAGADISELSNFSASEGRVLAQDGQKNVFNLIANSPKPIIAAINGFALGGGLELAMACHLRIASENAKLGLPEVSLGLIPGYGGTQRLTQLVGKGKALEMILTADMISAEEALKIGLVNHVVNSETLLPKVEEILLKILSRSPNALAAVIKAVNAGLEDGVNGFDVEIEEFANCFGTPQSQEGISAFLSKRQPNFLNPTHKV